MANNPNFLASQFALWAQPSGPNTAPVYLGCHGIGDVTEPKGDVTLLYCPDPSEVGKFKVKNSFQGTSDPVTFDIDTDIRKVADYLERTICPIPIFVHKVVCGRRDDFTNFERSYLMGNSRITSIKTSNLAVRTPGNNDKSTQTFSMAAEEVVRLFNLQLSRMSISETRAITAVAVGGENRCETNCGAAMKYGDVRVAVTGGYAASFAGTANVLYTATGSALVATAADPFEAGIEPAGALVIKVGKDTWRILVGQGETIGATPMTVKYSDDYGAAWTSATVGAVAGEFLANGHALASLDMRHIFIGTDQGNIYESEDGGVTWTLKQALATPIAAISFHDEAYGYLLTAAGNAYKTVDGGDNWGATSTAATGLTTARDIIALSPYFAYAVGVEGMFFTMDGGATWTARNGYNIAAIDYINEMVGIAVGYANAASSYYTIDGGYSWSRMPAVTNAGYRDVAMIGADSALVVGTIQGGTGFYGTVDPAP